MIRPDDDSFHPHTLHPKWNESAWFSFTIPERRIGGMLYLWYRPNMRYVCSGPIIWDPSGELPWDCLYYDYNWLQAIPEGADVLNAELPGGLSIEQVEPLQTYRLRYAGDGCELDFTWRSIGAPQELALVGSISGGGAGHYDQPGRLQGTLQVDGETFAVDCWSMRDRSWGVRDWQQLPRSDYLWGIGSESSWFLAATAEESLDAPDDVVLGGHHVHDGVYSPLVSGRRRTVERDGPRPVRVVIDAQDALGRSLQAEGRAASHFALQGYPDIFYWQTLMDWQLPDGTAVGDIAETLPMPRLRRLVRSLPGCLGRPRDSLEV